MSNSLDPDQALCFVGPDLGPNCLPRLSAEDTGRLFANLTHLNHLNVTGVKGCCKWCRRMLHSEIQ